MTPHELALRILESVRAMGVPDGYRLISREGDSKITFLLDEDCNTITDIKIGFRIKLDTLNALPDTPTIVE